MAFSKDEALDLLRRARSRNRLAHAYLISGPAGSGKRALAGDLAALAQEPPPQDPWAHPDIHVAEPESKSRRIVVGQIRSLERELQMRSSQNARKVAVIFDADRLVVAASNAFLKTLEEPPQNSLLLLTTAHPEMLLDTIISRCIPVPLQAGTKPELTPAQQALVSQLDRFFSRQTAGVGEVYQLTRAFQTLLSEAKEAIQKTAAAELKREESLYSQTTDGAWLEEREEYFKAWTESQYVRQRFALVDLLIQWLADILRHQQGHSRLDLPAHTTTTARLADEFSTGDLLRRMEALEQLREALGRNVQEALALEATFLRAFLR